MYTPPQFEETRTHVLVAAMREIRLAAIVTAADDALHTTHAPVLVREADGALALDFHVARGNPHARAAGPTVAIFQGPQAYISPGWYASKAEHGKVAPTWTYIAVHAHGTLEPMAGPDRLAAHLADLSDEAEAGRPMPWSVADAPDGFIDKLSRGIVGLTLSVDRLEGSWKMNQHKADADRAGAAAGLAASAAPQDRAVAAIMRRLEADRSGADA